MKQIEVKVHHLQKQNSNRCRKQIGTDAESEGVASSTGESVFWLRFTVVDPTIRIFSLSLPPLPAYHAAIRYAFKFRDTKLYVEATQPPPSVFSDSYILQAPVSPSPWASRAC